MILTSSNLCYCTAEPARMDSLYMVGWTGMLMEYTLSPHAAQGTDPKKVTDDSLLQLTACARAQWNLIRWVLECVTNC